MPYLLSLLIFFISFSSAFPGWIRASGDQKENSKYEYVFGGITRGDTSKQEIYIVFTGHEFADGFQAIKEALDINRIKCSFFFTGDFYRNPNYKDLITQLKKDGHYLGAHSDKHLLYASWENRDSTLLSKDELIKDINDNYGEIKKFGIEKKDALIFLPPYEWYNQEVAGIVNELGLTLVNFTSGTLSNADYTIPSMGKRYVTSDSIYKRIINNEETNPHGLNGAILLMHIGTSPERTDKFHNHLDALIKELKSRGYSFRRIDELIKLP